MQLLYNNKIDKIDTKKELFILAKTNKMFYKEVFDLNKLTIQIFQVQR